jgi:hypothetical protein
MREVSQRRETDADRLKLRSPDMKWLTFVDITLLLRAGVAKFRFQPDDKHRRKADHQTDRKTKYAESFIHNSEKIPGVLPECKAYFYFFELAG